MLRIVRRQLRKRPEQRRGLEAIEGEVELLDFLLLARRVLVLDNAADPPHRVAHDAPIGRRLFRAGREQHAVASALLRLLCQPCNRLRPDERHIPSQNDRIIAVSNLLLRGQDGVSGAQALRLIHIAKRLAQRFTQLLAAVSIYEHRLFRHGARRLGHPFHEAPPRRLVQYLGEGGMHPRALARRHNDYFYFLLHRFVPLVHSKIASTGPPPRHSSPLYNTAYCPGVTARCFSRASMRTWSPST